MDVRACRECEQLWAVHSYVTRELARMGLAECSGRSDLESSYVFFGNALAQHLLSHRATKSFGQSDPECKTPISLSAKQI